MKLKALAASLALVAGLFLAVPADRASAACGSIPYFFTNGTSIVDATTTNANNAFLIGCATTVDNSQIGVAGIFPSQVISTGVSTGTFGGAFPYRFALSSGTQVPLSIFGATSQAADLFDVFNNGGSVKYQWVDNAGLLHIGPGGLSFAISSATAAASNTMTIGVDGSANGVFRLNNGSASFQFQASTGVGGEPVQASNTFGGTLTFLTPMYTPSGVAVANTAHIVTGLVSPVGASATVTFSGNSVFTSLNTYTITVFDVTTNVIVTSGYSAISGTGFTFATTAGHNYTFTATGT